MEVDWYMPDVLVAGAINTDLVARVPRAPEAGETITGSTFNIFGGGKGANQALAAARSGAATAILGALGEDDFGRQRIADLRWEGIDVSAVAIRADAPSGVTLITVEERSGQNRIAYVPGATLTITPDEARNAVDSIRPTVFLATLELPPESLGSAIRAARAAGASVLLNATPEPERGNQFLADVDCLIVNEPEAAALLGSDPGTDWLAVAEQLRSSGPKWVIVTLGSEGAVATFDGRQVRVTVPEIKVTDTTGAGDALCGAFAAAISAGLPPEEALRRGVAAGSAACTIEGAQRSMPRADLVDELLARMA
jgi:ribokinase